MTPEEIRTLLDNVDRAEGEQRAFVRRTVRQSGDEQRRWVQELVAKSNHATNWDRDWIREHFTLSEDAVEQRDAWVRHTLPRVEEELVQEAVERRRREKEAREAAEQVQSLEGRTKNLNGQIAKLGAANRSLENQLQQTKAHADATQEELFGAQARVREVESRNQKLRERQTQQAKQSVREYEAEIERLETDIHELEQALKRALADSEAHVLSLCAR